MSSVQRPLRCPSVLLFQASPPAPALSPLQPRSLCRVFRLPDPLCHPRRPFPAYPLPWQEGSGREPLPSGRLARVVAGGGRGLPAHISLTVIPQGGGYPESTQSQGPRLVKLQPPALQAPSAVCPGGGPDPIAQPQPEALLPSPSSCDTGLLHSRLFPPSVATLLPWVPVIFVLTFPFFFGS